MLTFIYPKTIRMIIKVQLIYEVIEMKAILAIILCCSFILANTADARGREPCSGKMGGIAKCVGTKYLCNNGKVSKSKTECDPEIYNKSSKK